MLPGATWDWWRQVYVANYDSVALFSIVFFVAVLLSSRSPQLAFDSLLSSLDRCTLRRISGQWRGDESSIQEERSETYRMDLWAGVLTFLGLWFTSFFVTLSLQQSLWKDISLYQSSAFCFCIFIGSWPWISRLVLSSCYSRSLFSLKFQSLCRNLFVGLVVIRLKKRMPIIHTDVTRKRAVSILSSYHRTYFTSSLFHKTNVANSIHFRIW